MATEDPFHDVVPIIRLLERIILVASSPRMPTTHVRVPMRCAPCTPWPVIGCRCADVPAGQAGLQGRGWSGANQRSSPHSGTQHQLFQGTDGRFRLFIYNEQIKPGGTAHDVTVTFGVRTKENHRVRDQTGRGFRSGGQHDDGASVAQAIDERDHAALFVDHHRKAICQPTLRPS